jgi:hypothetical protein
MNVQFYATKSDFIEVLRFVWDNFSGRFFEDYSEFDRDLRWFETFEALTAYLHGPHHASTSIMFCLEEALQLLERERIELDPKTGGTFRYALRGWGLFQFLYENIERPYRRPRDPEKHKFFCQWPFRQSRVAVNSYKRAKLWEATSCDRISVDAWPWPEVERSARKIERFLRKGFVGRAPYGGGMLAGAADVIAAGPVWEGKPA